jgi:hypothetical protein
MDDRRAHFLTMLGDACVAAGLARLTVEILLNDGRRLRGTPLPQPADDGTGGGFEETGYSRRLLIDGGSAEVEDVVEFVVRMP